MFKRFGVLGLMLAAAATTLVQPTAALAQDGYRWGASYGYYGGNDRGVYNNHGSYRDDRDYRQDLRRREWRERQWREQAWREQEWRRQQRWDRGEYRDRYAPNYYGNPYDSRPY